MNGRADSAVAGSAMTRGPSGAAELLAAALRGFHAALSGDQLEDHCIAADTLGHLVDGPTLVDVMEELEPVVQELLLRQVRSLLHRRAEIEVHTIRRVVAGHGDLVRQWFLVSDEDLFPLFGQEHPHDVAHRCAESSLWRLASLFDVEQGQEACQALNELRVRIESCLTAFREVCHRYVRRTFLAPGYERLALMPLAGGSTERLAARHLLAMGSADGRYLGRDQ